MATPKHDVTFVSQNTMTARDTNVDTTENSVIPDSTLKDSNTSAADTKTQQDTHLSTESISEVKDKKETQEVLLFTSLIAWDGIGDAKNFVEVANPRVLNNIPECQAAQIIHLVMCSKADQSTVSEILKANQMESTIVIPIGKMTPEHSLEGYLSQEKLFDVMKTVTTVYNVSTYHMSALIRPYIAADVPVVSIGELGASTFVKDLRNLPQFPMEDNSCTNSPQFRHFGFSTNAFGLMMGEKSKYTHAEALSKIEDKDFWKLYLGQKCLSQNAGSIDIKSADELVKKELLIPFHFQEGPESFSAIFHGTLCSEIVQSSGYEVITFIGNEGNFKTELLDANYLAKHGVIGVEVIHASRDLKSQALAVRKGSHQFLAPSIPGSTSKTEIRVTTHRNADGKEDAYTAVFPLRAKLPTNRQIKVRVLEYRLNDMDFEWLLQSAQIFLGCSGDNMWKKALQYGLIPLLQCRPHKIRSLHQFTTAMAQAVPDVDLPNFSEFHSTCSGEIEKRGSFIPALLQVKQILKSDLLRAWPRVIAHMHTYYNYGTVLPFIIKQNSISTQLRNLIKQNDKASRIKTLENTIESLEKRINANHVALLHKFFSRFGFRANVPVGEELLVPDKVTNLHVDLKYKFFIGKTLEAVLDVLALVRKLEALEIDGNEAYLKPVWSKVTSVLSANLGLQTLSSFGNCIDDQMAKPLLDCLKALPNLSRLNLSANLISQTVHITTFLMSAKSIDYLNLALNKITDEGVKVLVKGIAANKSLRVLDLTENPITDAGKKLLIQSIQSHPTLKEVWFGSENLCIGSVAAKYTKSDKRDLLFEDILSVIQEHKASQVNRSVSTSAAVLSPVLRFSGQSNSSNIGANHITSNNLSPNISATHPTTGHSTNSIPTVVVSSSNVAAPLTTTPLKRKGKKKKK